MPPISLQVSLVLAIGGAPLALAQVDASNALQLALNRALTVQRTSSVPATYDLMNWGISHTNVDLFPPREPFHLDRSSHYFSSPQIDRIEDESAFADYSAKALVAGDLLRKQQLRRWQMFEDDIVSYAPSSRACRLSLCYGSGFEAPRNTYEGEQGFGLRFQFGLGKRKQRD